MNDLYKALEDGEQDIFQSLLRKFKAGNRMSPVVFQFRNELFRQVTWEKA